MATHKLYESASVLASWNGLDVLKGRSADVFLTIEPRGKRNTVTTGADGFDAVAKMANRGAVITVNLLMTSEGVEDIYTAILAQDIIGASVFIGNFLVRDAHDVVKFLALNAKITDVPTYTFNNGESVAELTFVWECESYYFGNDLSSVQSIIQELTNYI